MRIDIGHIGDEEIAKIKEATQTRETIEFYSNVMTREIEENFQRVLVVFLTACNQTHLFNCLSYCTLELLANANKANAKRLYFKEQNLNITNEKDYSSGMENFKAALSGNKIHYMTELETSLLEIHLFLTSDDVITVKVSNNTQITPFEYQRIQEKIAMAKQYDSMEAALTCVDQTEGSGLGLIIIVLMLKELGLDETHLKYDINSNETVATIEIPLDSYAEL